VQRNVNPSADSPAASPARLAKAERDELRRLQIANALARCVLRTGFHRASMAQVAEEAGMSVGQIYRYFPSKEAIIGFLVEQIVAARLAWIDAAPTAQALAESLAADTPPPRPPGAPTPPPGTLDAYALAGERALLLEIQAESARNPAVAELVKAADLKLHARAVATMRSQQPALSQAQAALRVEIVASLAEGRLFREGIGPALDRQQLVPLLRRVVDLLFLPD